LFVSSLTCVGGGECVKDKRDKNKGIQSNEERKLGQTGRNKQERAKKNERKRQTGRNKQRNKRRKKEKEFITQ
jgi:hypothetical protein